LIAVLEVVRILFAAEMLQTASRQSVVASQCGADSGEVRRVQPNISLVWIVDEMPFKQDADREHPGQKRRVTTQIKREFKRRAAIEPVIGHLKAHHRWQHFPRTRVKHEP
jgi:hypothetical protein